MGSDDEKIKKERGGHMDLNIQGRLKRHSCNVWGNSQEAGKEDMIHLITYNKLESQRRNKHMESIKNKLRNKTHSIRQHDPPAPPTQNQNTHPKPYSAFLVYLLTTNEKTLNISDSSPGKVSPASPPLCWVEFFLFLFWSVVFQPDDKSHRNLLELDLRSLIL